MVAGLSFPTLLSVFKWLTLFWGDGVEKIALAMAHAWGPPFILLTLVPSLGLLLWALLHGVSQLGVLTISLMVSSPPTTPL